VVALALAGCQSGALPATPPLAVRTFGSSFIIPSDVERLEGTTFQLKDKRSTLKIVDRFNLAAVLLEQRFQASGTVTGDSAVRIGHMLGVDSAALFDRWPDVARPVFRSPSKSGATDYRANQNHSSRECGSGLPQCRNGAYGRWRMGLGFVRQYGLSSSE